MPRTSNFFLNSPGVASALRRYLRRCSGLRWNKPAISKKLLITVLLPSTWPRTLGMDRRTVASCTSGSCFLAFSRSCSYVSMNGCSSRHFIRVCA